MSKTSRRARRANQSRNQASQPARKIVETKDNRKVDVSGTPYTSGYRSVPHIWFQRPRDLPPFSFATIRGMLLDPEVRLCFATRAAPIYGAEFGYEVETQPGMPKQWKQGVECKHPEIGNYVYRQLERIWRNHLPAILRAQVWGWSAGEVTFKLSESGMVEIDKMEPRHAADCRLLKVNNKRWGVVINRVEGAGAVNLPFPYAWIHNYNAEDGDDYGVSAALGAYSPWADKWFQGGALDVRRLFMHKDAYGGMSIGYPDGDVWVPGQTEPVPAVDIARQIAEETMSGGVIVKPSDYDENGNEKWPIERAQVSGNPGHILQYPKDCDVEIRHGFEIPDGVADSAGSGEYAGKRVTVAGFYCGLDAWVVQLACDIKEQILDPLVSLNFGFVPEYEIKHKPLAKQAMEQQGQTEQQSAGQQPGQMQGHSAGMAMGPGQFGQYGQQQATLMGLGGGEFSVDEVVEAGRRIARLALQASDAKIKPDTCPRDKLGCVMLEIPLEFKEQIRTIAMDIDEELMATNGVEQWPHTTLLYGIVGASVHEIVQAVRDLESIEITFGETTAFESEEHTVLKIDIESEAIHKLRESISRTLPYVETFPDYKPHITLAYLKPGEYPELYGPNVLTGKTARITHAVASMDGKRINIPLDEPGIARMALDKPEVIKDDDLGEGSWITIGAEKTADSDEKTGGQSVFVGTDGRMKTGKFAGKTMGEAFGEGGAADGGSKSPGTEAQQQPEPERKPKSFSSHLGNVKTSGYTKGERFEHKGQMYEVTSAEKPRYISRQAAEAEEDFDNFDVKPGWHQQYTAKPVDKNEAELKRDADKQAQKQAAETKAREGQAKFDAVANADGMSTAISWPAGVPQPQWEEVHNDIDNKFGRGNRYYIGEVDGVKVAKSTYNAYDDFRESHYFPDSITQSSEAKKGQAKAAARKDLLDLYHKQNEVNMKLRMIASGTAKPEVVSQKNSLEADKKALDEEHEKAAVKFFKEYGELSETERTSAMKQRASSVGMSFGHDHPNAAGLYIARKQLTEAERKQVDEFIALGINQSTVDKLQTRAESIAAEREAEVRKLGGELEPERLQSVLDRVKKYFSNSPEATVESELEEQQAEQAKKAARQAAAAQKKSSPRSSSGSASWAKLRSGEWGARVDGSVKVGDKITITARDGRKQTKTVQKVVHEGDDYSMVQVMGLGGRLRKWLGSLISESTK